MVRTSIIMSKKNIISIEDRIPNLREQRRKKANRRFMFYLGIITCLILIIIYLESPLSHIRMITVEGDRYLSDERIIESSGLTDSTSIWSFRTSEIEDQLMEINEIKTAEVSRNLPFSVELKVETYQKLAYLKNGDLYYPLLENNATLSPVTLNQWMGDAPLIIGFDQTDELLINLLSEFEETPTHVLRQISEVYHTPTESNPYQVTLNMVSGFEVLTNIRGFNLHMRVYPSIVSQLDPADLGRIEIDTTGAVFRAFDADVQEMDPDLEIFVDGEMNEGIYEEGELE